MMTEEIRIDVLGDRHCVYFVMLLKLHGMSSVNKIK